MTYPIDRTLQRGLRILQVVSGLGVDEGGPSEGAIRLHQEWRRKGHAVRLVATDRHLTRLPPPTEFNAHLVRSRTMGRFEVSPGLLWGIARGIRDADVVYIHGYYLLSSLIAMLLARLTRTPYVLHAHGIFDPYTERASPKRKSLYRLFGGQAGLKAAAAIVFASSREAEEADLRGATPQRWVVPLGAVATQHRQTVEREHGHILFLGRVTKKKRVDVLLGTLQLLCDRGHRPLLTIAGPDPDNMLRTWCLELHGAAKQQLRLLGLVEGEAKEVAYRQASIFVLPSENENFGVSVAEAATYGLAIVTTPAVAVAAQMEQAGAAVTTSLSAAAFADCLQSILVQPAWADELGMSAAAYASANFSWATTAMTLADKLRETI